MLKLRDIQGDQNDVLIEKQIGSCQQDTDAPSLYRVSSDGEYSFFLEIYIVCYDGYFESSDIPIFVEDFSWKKKLDWNEVKESCFSDKKDQDIEQHRLFIEYLNGMT